MAGETFGIGEQRGLGAENAESLRGILLHGDELDEVVDAEAAADAGHAAGGQGVIGAGDVIAHGLRRPAADEDRARVPDPIEIGGRVHGEVLGSEPVRNRTRLAEVGRDDGEAIAGEGFARYGIISAEQFRFGDDRLWPGQRVW